MVYFRLPESISDRESHPDGENDGEFTDQDDERENVFGDALNRK